MINLKPCSDMTVDKAYIITLKDHVLSESLSLRCQQSCQQVGQPYQVWPAFNGTSGTIQTPEQFKDQSWVKWIRQYDTDLSVTEVAAYFSHLSLWIHCVEINMPIVILEHDAIMVNAYRNHFGYNQLVYLGCREQASGWKVTPIPPMACKNDNYRFMLRAHAYAVDPFSAKNLIAHTIKYGINESLDITMRTDVFGVVQGGFFAYDAPHQITTITDRKKKSDGTER
jgi:hypothetical protein